MSGFLSSLEQFVAERMNAGEDKTTPEYATMKYPKLIPFMRFSTRRVEVEELGSITMMSTVAMGGLMKLLTVTFVPNKGRNVPFLLVDCMEMKKKHLAYVEYYDCTGKSMELQALTEVAERYAKVPDYAEKDAWYVSERMKGSMIKGGEGVEADRLYALVVESIETYLKCVAEADVDETNIQGLRAFQDRMVKDGNPSQGTMSKVLGEEGAEKFFRDYVMPV